MMNGQVFKDNNKVYNYITDLFFEELSRISCGHSRTFNNSEEMIEEYARATVLEHLSTMLQAINRDHPEIMDPLEYNNLKKAYDMQRPYKGALMSELLQRCERKAQEEKK